MGQYSVKLPLKVTPKVVSVMMPIRETVWVVDGFIISERIVGWKKQDLTILENIKSRILTEIELLNRNQVKIKWYGESVPQVMIFTRRIGDDWGNTPIATIPWDVGEYVMDVDLNEYEVRILGIQNTGEADSVVFGANQEYDINFDFVLPVNEKYYFLEIDVTSTYEIEVSL